MPRLTLTKNANWYREPGPRGGRSRIKARTGTPELFYRSIERSLIIMTTPSRRYVTETTRRRSRVISDEYLATLLKRSLRSRLKTYMQRKIPLKIARVIILSCTRSQWLPSAALLRRADGSPRGARRLNPTHPRDKVWVLALRTESGEYFPRACLTRSYLT